eukprot:m.49658 g.49658  ORF g.49658 m.49658 type:complete len:174 (-) comp8969_c0_seq1:407-928(-)
MNQKRVSTIPVGLPGSEEERFPRRNTRAAALYILWPYFDTSDCFGTISVRQRGHDNISFPRRISAMNHCLMHLRWNVCLHGRRTVARSNLFLVKMSSSSRQTGQDVWEPQWSTALPSIVRVRGIRELEPHAIARTPSSGLPTQFSLEADSRFSLPTVFVGWVCAKVGLKTAGR